MFAELAPFAAPAAFLAAIWVFGWSIRHAAQAVDISALTAVVLAFAALVTLVSLFPAVLSGADPGARPWLAVLLLGLQGLVVLSRAIAPPAPPLRLTPAMRKTAVPGDAPVFIRHV